MVSVKIEELSFRILKNIRSNKGYYRDLLIEKMQGENFSFQEIQKSINYLRTKSMITCHGFHIAYVVHPNVELIFKKNPKINVIKFLNIWNDPDQINELWEDEENEQ